VEDPRVVEEEEEEELLEVADKLFSTTVEKKDILHVTIKTQCIHPVSITESLIM